MKDIPIVYENQDMVIVDKPCGIPVQGGAGISVCLLDILERQFASKMFPVHRLDRDTAGLLVVARNSASAARYARLFASDELEKVYYALCFGVPNPVTGTIRSRAGKAGSEKPADTAYSVVASASEASLLRLILGTGRMHQIRIHVASIGCPVIADDKYGDFKKNREVRSLRGIRKLQLAACSLSLPVEGKRRVFTTGLPAHMAEALASFGFDTSLDR